MTRVSERSRARADDGSNSLRLYFFSPKIEVFLLRMPPFRAFVTYKWSFGQIDNVLL